MLNCTTRLLNTTEIRDHDNDGVPDLMVKFARQELIPLLKITDAKLSITGKLTGGIQFEGSDTIAVISKGKR